MAHSDPLARRAPELAEALEPAERDALARALAEGDPAAEAAVARWEAARRALAVDLPSPRLVALYALADDPLVLGPEEEAELEAARPSIEAALAAHPALRAALERVRADRDAFDAVWEAQQGETPPRPPTPARPPVAPARRRSAGRWVWRSATGVALVLFLALLVVLVRRDAGFETVQAGARPELVYLADGSTVQLAAHARLETRLRADDRRARLLGDALFEVVPGHAPFVVETPSALTTVLGTTFAVRAGVQETEVVLVSGAVALAARAEPEAAVRLEPGQRARVRTGAPPSAPEPADVAEALAWTGTWYFRATPLGDIAERLAAHYGVEVRVPPALADERVTGAFEQRAPLEQTLQTLAAALGVSVEGDAASGYRFVAPGR